MATRLSSLEDRSDAELISAVRSGDVDAYGELFARHVDAARRLARQLVAASDVDDLVSEAFAKVLGVLQRGGGPDLAFRAYLLTAVRRLQVDRIRARSRLHTTDDLTPFDPGVPFKDTAVEGFENATAARAFAALPERWQLVIWHTEVEGQKPADVAPLLGMSPNAVSALAYRAREGLRQAYLSLHATDVDDDACERTRAQLGSYVRGGLARRDAKRVEDHLEDCRPCTAIYLELVEVNADLRGLLAPLLLGSAAAAYLGTTGTGAAAATGVVALLGRARDAVVAHAPTAAVAGAAATAVVAGVGITLHQQPQDTGASEAPTLGTAPTAGGATRTPSTPAASSASRPAGSPAGTPAGPDARRSGRTAPAGAPGGTTQSTPPGPAGPASSGQQASAGHHAEPQSGGHHSAASPSGAPSAAPSGAPAAPRPATPAPLVKVKAQVSAGPRGVGVVVGLDLGGATIVPETSVGVPLPPSG